MLPYLLPSMENWNEVLNFTIKAVNSVNDSLSFKKNAELDPEALDAKGDMLSRWSAVKLSDPTKMNTRDIVVHLSTNVFAGSDTTAIALRAIFYFLLKNPAKMKKLVRQINEADVGRHLSNPISYKEAITHLPYLNAVIKESVRLHPSVGLLLERHVPPGGNTICNTHIPGNTIVGINAWVTQQDPSVFDSPEEFRPERWMESEGVSVEKIKEMDTSYFAFGAGSRTCLGRNISIIEMTKVVPQILREFEVRLDPPEREWKVTNKWFVQQEDFIVKLERRRH